MRGCQWRGPWALVEVEPEMKKGAEAPLVNFWLRLGSYVMGGTHRDRKPLSRRASSLERYIAFDVLIEIYRTAGIGQHGAGKIIGQRSDMTIG